MHPDYIVLDEPTAMLDPKGRKEVMEALQRLNQEQEMTVILITHDMEEAALASRVILLADGQVRFDGTPEKFFGADVLLAEMGMEAPLSYRVQQAMGSAANLQSGAGEKRDKCKIDALDTFEKDKDLLSLQHVSYIYSLGTAYEKVALDDVNLSLGKGEIVGLAGHTGSGKSTMIQLLNGLLKPTSGTVTFEGKDIHAKGYSGNYLR